MFEHILPKPNAILATFVYRQRAELKPINAQFMVLENSYLDQLTKVHIDFRQHLSEPPDEVLQKFNGHLYRHLFNLFLLQHTINKFHGPNGFENLVFMHLILAFWASDDLSVLVFVVPIPKKT